MHEFFRFDHQNSNCKLHLRINCEISEASKTKLEFDMRRSSGSFTYTQNLLLRILLLTQHFQKCQILLRGKRDLCELIRRNLRDKYLFF